MVPALGVLAAVAALQTYAALEPNTIDVYPQDTGFICNDLAECAEGEQMKVEFLQSGLWLQKGSALEIDDSAPSSLLSVPPVDVTTATTTSPPNGMTPNSEGDPRAFLTASVLTLGGSLLCVFFFCISRLRYPLVYANNVIEGFAPSKPEETFFGWFWPTINVTVDQVAESISLDHAMMLEYCHLSMKLMAVIGIPMMFSIGGMKRASGGLAAGADHLTYFAFGNVENLSRLHWIHGFVVWAVVLTLTASVHSAMRKFLPRRFKWLKELPTIRANTVLIEQVPLDFLSADKIRGFIRQILPSATVKAIDFVKDTSALEGLVAARLNAAYSLRKAVAEWDRSSRAPSQMPTVREGRLGSRVKAIPYWEKELQIGELKVKQERARILAESENLGGVNLSSVFVVFGEQSSAEIMIRLSNEISDDKHAWLMTLAPEPTDVLWTNLSQSNNAKGVRELIGYLLAGALYFAYMPLVIGIRNLAKHIDLSAFGLAIVQPFCAGFVPTVGLEFLIAFVPAFLMLLFKAFFTLKSEALQQHKLQVWYFWFQVMFVLLVTAVGQNFRQFGATLFTQPFQVFAVMTEAVPHATHFYKSFLVLQVLSHAVNMTRWIPLLKFKAANQIFEEKESKVLAEPEDQACYGAGSRSARWTITLAIGIVFGTLCPPILLLVFLNFAACRVIYGYLICFAETKKADLGGAFWVLQLKHLFIVCIMYVILMSVVLAVQAANAGPAIIAALSLLWILPSFVKFQKYKWERLPMQELVEREPSAIKPKDCQYIQPEMLS